MSQGVRDTTIVLFLCGLLPLMAAAAWGGVLTESRIEVDALSEAPEIGRWCFSGSTLGLIVVAASWWRTHRLRSTLEMATVLWAVGAGVYFLVGTWNDGSVDVLPPDQETVPAWLTILGGLVLAAVMQWASHGQRLQFRRFFRVTHKPNFDEVRRLVGRLDYRRQEKLLDERRRAIRRLTERGLIDRTQAARVESLPLGCSPMATDDD